MVKLNKFKKYFPLLLIAIGIGLRFYFQFMTPCFNDDEIMLGNNIKYRSLFQLLYPLDEFQSAPPLYLILQKIITFLPIPFWISIKLLSFIVSSLIIIFAFKLASRIFENSFLQIFFLSFFLFNPFIVYNSLTLKQYGIDLLFVLILLSYYRELFIKIPFFFFLVWSLISNIGLFYATGIILFKFVDFIYKNKSSNLLNFIKKQNYFCLKLCLSVLPYVSYFIWYMNQKGAAETKEFMDIFWKSSFIPLNIGVFKYMAYFSHGIGIFFLNSRITVYIILLIVLSVGIWKVVKIKNKYIIKLFLIASSGIFINVILNLVHLYPLSDRLYLYFAPLIYIVLVYSLLKNSQIIVVVFLLIVSFLYLYDLPFRENNILRLKSVCSDKKVFLNYRANRDLIKFNKFTDNYFGHIVFHNSDFKSSKYYITRVQHKFGSEFKHSLEDKSTIQILANNKIILFKKIEGYNIYLIN